MTTPPRLSRLERGTLALLVMWASVCLLPVVRFVSPALSVEVSRAAHPDPSMRAWSGDPDPWGNPWELRDGRVLPADVEAARLLRGWSRGPDGRNDWGRGDDVAVPAEPPGLVARALAVAASGSGLIAALVLCWVAALPRTLARRRAPTVRRDVVRALLVASVPAALAAVLGMDRLADLDGLETSGQVIVSRKVAFGVSARCSSCWPASPGSSRGRGATRTRRSPDPTRRPPHESCLTWLGACATRSGERSTSGARPRRSRRT